MPADNVFSIAMHGYQVKDHMVVNLTSNDGSKFSAILSGVKSLQPNVGGFMTRTQAEALQAYLTTVLG